MPPILIPLLIALIEATPALVEAIGSQWALLKRAAAEGRDITPDELIQISASALRASADLRATVAARTAPGGDWAKQ